VGPHHNLNVTVKGSKKAHQPINGIFTECSFEHSRYFGLANSHKLSSLGLGKFTLISKTIYLRHDLRLKEMCFRIRQTQIRENVLTTSY
jgi:hypothetical protein